jgi:phosphogluconate dehydratase
MLMEFMGLHLPGASFINPNTPLREAITREGVRRALAITALGNEYTPVCDVLDERAFVNGVVGLHATGGSTNLSIHLIAMAQAAGIRLSWGDMAEISEVVPLLARVYPNGVADVNHFHAAGGLAFMIGELLGAGLLHPDTRTVVGDGLAAYTREPKLGPDGEIRWEEGAHASHDTAILRPASDPFQATGGLKLLAGNLGAGIIKTSAVKPERHIIEAPARIFHGQDEVKAAFKAGELNRDVVCVVRFQGPKANGMPELHALTPLLGLLQDKGFKVALVTDGRMSGASGKVPAAIHVSPEAAVGGAIGKLRDGDVIRVDAVAGTLEALVPAAELLARDVAEADLEPNGWGNGRELFAAFRSAVGSAEAGATVF